MSGGVRGRYCGEEVVHLEMKQFTFVKTKFILALIQYQRS